MQNSKLSSIRTACVIAACIVGRAAAQWPSVELLSPGDEGFDGLPVHIRCVDVFVDVGNTDVWTAAGIRALTENGAALVYADGDVNVPGLQPDLINPGFANRFATSLSKPRNRNGVARFENAGAAVAGAFDPTGLVPDTTPALLNVAWFASPPATAGSPSVDGYIARIAVDIAATGLPLDYPGWGVSLINAIPPGAAVVLCSVPLGQTSGTMVADFDHTSGISWALWQVPEPTTGVMAAVILVMGRAGRRSFKC